MKRIHVTTNHVLERFALLLCIGIMWPFAAVLTVSGAYSTAKVRTQESCRTDRSYLISSAPWYIHIYIQATIPISLILNDS